MFCLTSHFTPRTSCLTCWPGDGQTMEDPGWDTPMTLKLLWTECHVISPVWLAGETVDYWHCAGLTSHHWQPWQPGAGPGLKTRGDRGRLETSPGQGSSLQWADLASPQHQPACQPKTLDQDPGCHPARVHTRHDTSIPFLPPLGFTNHSPLRPWQTNAEKDFMQLGSSTLASSTR